jgi:hypothetical protein
VETQVPSVLVEVALVVVLVEVVDEVVVVEVVFWKSPKPWALVEGRRERKIKRGTAMKGRGVEEVSMICVILSRGRDLNGF